MESLLFGLVAGSGLTWAFMSFRRDYYWREFNARRRGSNPPSPGRKPAPPAGPPEQPLVAQLIRYWACRDEQVRQAWFDPRMGEPWPEDCESASNPPIKPQPTGGRLIKSWEEPLPPSES